MPFERELSQLAVRGRTARWSSIRWSRTITRTASCVCRWRRRPDIDAGLAELLAATTPRACWKRWITSACWPSSSSSSGGELIANEMAPRVHNSGHWTIEGAETSQFENHLRAMLGLPLGSPQCARPCAMVNLIGELPTTSNVLAVPGTHLHLYGKKPRPGRKIGHLTVCAAGMNDVRQRVERLR